jgi:phenylacetic acid degradation protein
MTYEFNNIKPVIQPSSFIHPQATIVGNVIIGKDCYIGPHATLRGDWGKIIIEDGCNVQESCTIHMFPGITVLLKANSHIGHGAIIHGATIGQNCLVGMNAVIMDNVILGNECIVGALSFIKADEVFEDRSLIVGNPAKAIKKVTDDMISWKTNGTQLYQQLPKQLYQSLKECEPLTEIPANQPDSSALYKTWNETK